ncbi:MAG: HEAT repeat domain-containing protein [Pseudomonadota bacterium]
MELYSKICNDINNLTDLDFNHIRKIFADNDKEKFTSLEKALLISLDHYDEKLKLYSSYLLIKYGYDKQTTSKCLLVLKSSLESSDADTKRLSCKIMADLGYSCFASKIYELIDDDNFAVKREAYFALVQLKNPKFLNLLKNKLQAEEEDFIYSKEINGYLDDSIKDYFKSLIKILIFTGFKNNNDIILLCEKMNNFPRFKVLKRILLIRNIANKTVLCNHALKDPSQTTIQFLDEMIMDSEIGSQINYAYLFEYIIFNKIDKELFESCLSLSKERKEKLIETARYILKLLALRTIDLGSYDDIKRSLWLLENLIIVLGIAFKCKDKASKILSKLTVNFSITKKITKNISDKELKVAYSTVIQNIEMLFKGKKVDFTQLSKLIN